MFASCRYSTMVSFILSTTFSVTEIPPRSFKQVQLKGSAKILKVLHTGFNICNILEERPKGLLNMFLIDVNRLTLPKPPQDQIFENIF